MSSTAVRETTVAASIVRDMLQYLSHRGVNVDAINGVDVASLRSSASDTRVRGSQVERLWQFAIEQTGDQLIGLHMAEAYNPGALDMLGYIVLSCSTIGHALDRASRYATLLNDGMRIDFVREPRSAYLECTFVSSKDNYLLRNGTQAVDTTWAGFARELRRLAAKPVVPTHVWFRHAAPHLKDKAEYDRSFGALVNFGASADRLYVNTDDLEMPLLSANPALLRSFEQHADTVIASLDAKDTKSRQVAQLLTTRLKGAVPPLNEIARELAMSERNLQRALRNDGTTFNKLLDDVRRDLAINHLADPSTSAGQVGFLLGFSEPSAFHRAFRRWTGKAPSAYRVSA